MYIVFEGIVGSGKSTQSKLLTEYFKSIGKEVVYVREPGGTKIAEEIRILAQGKIWEDEEMHPTTNAYLYSAARAQLLQTVVKPALREGKIVISDRCFLSSCAYQGEAQGLGIETVFQINGPAVNRVVPTHIFYMKADLEKSLSRTFDAAGDKWETKGKEFFEKVLVGYEKSIELFKALNKPESGLEDKEVKIFEVDANGTIEDINKYITSIFGE